MLDEICRITAEYVETRPKKERKKIGQFFTSLATAMYMAGMFDVDLLQGEITMLDPGAGSGILTAAVIDRLESIDTVISVRCVCYENNPDILPILRQNLQYIAENSIKPFEYELREQDYLMTQALLFETNGEHDRYDLVIANPPYLRVLKDHEAAVSMPTVVHGAPNLYFLFTAMGLFNLAENKEMVYIIPRSWTSGAYFERFRQYLFGNSVIEHIHLFVSRDKVFDNEQVLQETMIIKVRKNLERPADVLITSTNTNNDFNEITELYVPYDIVVNGAEYYVYLPINSHEVDVIRKMNTYNHHMLDDGYKMKTGIIVDFRQYDDLRETPEGCVPLFYAQHIKDGRVNHEPSGKKYDWAVSDKLNILQLNKNYLFVKRFTAKEEKRRLQCGIYLAGDFPGYAYIGTQNKMNFIDWIDKSLPNDLELVYGLYALFNSTLYDEYYRILNGSTQVNSTEINNFPMPPVDVVRKIGLKLLKVGSLSTFDCDKIIEEVAYHG